jgi:hypothetical protein
MRSMANSNESNPAWWQLVQRHVGSLRFGVVQIVVHDRRVVQIERTEKVRFDRDADEPESAP